MPTCITRKIQRKSLGSVLGGDWERYCARLHRTQASCCSLFTVVWVCVLMCDFIILIMNDTIHFEPRFFFLLNLYECICPYANYNYGSSGQSEWFHIYGILLKQLPSRFPELKTSNGLCFENYLVQLQSSYVSPTSKTRAFSSGPSVSERLQNEPCSIVVACPGPRGKGGLLRLQGWKVAGNCQTTNPHSAIQTNKRYIPASKKRRREEEKKNDDIF